MDTKPKKTANLSLKTGKEECNLYIQTIEVQIQLGCCKNGVKIISISLSVWERLDKIHATLVSGQTDRFGLAFLTQINSMTATNDDTTTHY